MGDGKREEEKKRKAEGIDQVEFMGFVSPQRYGEYMSGAKFLIVPSLCYENFPRVVAESYSYGIPVLASSLGGFPEIVQDKETGLLFRSGDADDLLAKVQWFITQEGGRQKMRERIREVHAQTYSARRNYEMLMDIYKKALTRRKSN